jgi:hypothetical protein
MGPTITVHYNGNVEASMQGYCKGSVGSFITVYNISYVDASMQEYIKISVGPSYRSIIIVN